MSYKPDCPKCGNNYNVVARVRTSSAVKGAFKKIGAGLAYMSTPIFKGFSQDAARRWSADADVDFRDMRYHCNTCNTDFD